MPRASRSLRLTFRRERLKQQEYNDPIGTLRVLGEWAESKGPEQVKMVRQVVDELVLKDRLRPVDVFAAFKDDRDAGAREAQLRAAVAAVAESDVITKEGAVARLHALLLDAAAKQPELVRQSLSALHQRDFEQVMPLAEADAHLGGVAAKAWQDERSIAVRLGLETPAEVMPVVQARAVPAEAGGEIAGNATLVANRLYPEVAHKLRQLKTQLELRAAADASFDVRDHAAITAAEIVKGVDERSSRALLSEVAEWADRLVDELEQAR